MYKRLAIQESYGLKRISCPQTTRKELDAAYGSLGMSDLRFDAETGMVDISDEIRQEGFGKMSVLIDNVEVSTNPRDCDVLDDARYLVALDSDYAQKDNDKGFDKADTNKIRLILAQATQIGLRPQDVLTLVEMSHKYREQLAEVYAYYCGLTVAEVLAIRKTRLSNGDLEESDRVIMLTDEQADPSVCSHVYFDPVYQAIAVNIKGGDARSLAAWRDKHINQEPFRSFYSEVPKFIKNRSRTVRGEKVDRRSLLFPATQGVAQALIKGIKELYSPVIINDDVQRIAEGRDVTPPAKPPRR